MGCSLEGGGGRGEGDERKGVVVTGVVDPIRTIPPWCFAYNLLNCFRAPSHVSLRCRERCCSPMGRTQWLVLDMREENGG